ncbi:zinc finger CDGSH-type domain protein [Methanococcus vannielii SB]|jgi:CDGSH-type Zn-finger protein|uniref:Zinc finger CDGSH-type domain protein n=1 Tax=Methanococcus vannielii (strain ATCC 35089 / DSM 1224 / JCM 13029 / OCM 148 / SB) TaxID=406327 RepID=A6UNI4_METVS|nr:CDGSH iron-sulfur domain-containing protein [Methanococcus vannielii]ABR54056.1 zinc finger CDGSH-type domain protein [Methanococcus vannielii SB]
MSLEKKIKIIKNGPYIVTGSIPLYQQVIVTDEDNHAKNLDYEKEYPIKETYSLCRCGKSKNMPYCDGTHVKIGFDGTETASKEPYLKQAEIFEGPELKLTDAHEFCDHSRFCNRAGGIRKLIECSNDQKAKQIAIEEATICPSGRLVLWDKKTGNPFEKEFEPSIVLIQDSQKKCQGPIWVRGKIPIESYDGQIYEIRNRITLCRCGKSENKPYCDGSHWMTKEQKLNFRKKWGLD